MKVAILSDIHANISALERVLGEVRGAGIEKLVLLGDYVGYYYEPARVVAQLRSWDCEAILGNHDRMALAARHGDTAVLAEYRARYGRGLDVALEQLGEKDWQWLEGLPIQKTINLAAWRIHLAHGSPFDDDAYVYPDAAAERISRTVAGVDADAVWLGHTHWPFHSMGRPAVLNPGSVGQPRDLGGAASWVIFHSDTGSASFRRTEFPVAHLQSECARRDPAMIRNRELLTRRRLRPGEIL